MKILKVSLVIIISVLVILYLCVLFVVPNVVNLNKFKPDLQKIVKDETQLNIDFSNAKITVTPLLSAGVKVDNFVVDLADNSQLAKVDSCIARVSLPHLLFKTLKVTKAEVINPHINIDIIDGKEYKLTKYLVIKQNTENDDINQEQFDINSIKIHVPEVKILNYSIVANDLKTKDFLKLQGNELVLSYNDARNVTVKTLAELLVNDTKNIVANVDIDTFIPAFNEKTESKSNANVQELEPKQQIPSFINPVAVYKTYNLKANIDSKIKIRQKNNKVVSDGYFNIDDLSLMLSGIEIPNSKLHITTKNTNISANTELYITNLERILANGSFDYGKNPQLEMKVNSNEIHTSNVLKLVEAALNSANVKNELSSIQGTGFFIADTEFKTDFKKINSKGNIKFHNIDIKDTKTNTRIAKINSIILLDDSTLKFTDTTVETFDTVFSVDGTINQDSTTNLSVVMQKMHLEKVFKFLPSEISRNYNVNSGMVDLNANLIGKLRELNAKINMSVSNLSLKDKVNNITYLNNLLNADFTSDLKTFKGVINNSDFRLNMNGANVSCDKLSLNVGDKDIVINPATIKINNATNVNISGTIKDYLKNPIFNVDAKGAMRTIDLKQLLGPDIAIYIKEKGTLPLVANITGDSKKQTLKASISADANNYITPINISSVLNKNTVINLIADIKDNKITIHNSGFFIKNGETQNAIALIEGVISKLDTKNPVINEIKLKIPSEITGSLVIFPQSKLHANGNILVTGNLNAPVINGNFNIANVSIPELYLTLEKANIKIDNKNLDLALQRLLANGSDYDMVINADLTPSTNFIIKNLNILSNYTDADKVMKVSEAFTKYTTPVSASNTNKPIQGSSNNTANIPVVIKSGSIDIKKIKSGQITLTNTTGKISMSKNVFYIKELVTSAFQGNLSGDVSMNLITSEIKANVKGNNMDVAQTLLETASMKDMLTGTMEFNANVALKGSTYEQQVKSLKGSVDFTMKNGSLGPLGKIENLVTADNISTTSAIKKLVGNVLTSTIDTSRYSTLQGHLNFNNGVAQINPITSAGDYMSTYIFGNFDVLKNTADMKLRGRLGSRVTDSMGQLAMLNPINIVKSSSNMNMILGTLMLKMCEVVTDKELAQIPAIAKETNDANSAKFQVVIRGDAAKPLKLIRSFKWLATETQMKEAKAYLGTLNVISIPKDTKELKQQAKDILKNLTSEGTNQAAQQGKDAINAVKSLLGTQSSEGNQKTTTSFKDQLKQVGNNALKQLAEQAKQAATTTNTSGNTNETQNKE